MQKIFARSILNMLKHSEENTWITIQMKLGYNNGDWSFINLAFGHEKATLWICCNLKFVLGVTEKIYRCSWLHFCCPWKGLCPWYFSTSDSSSPTAILVAVWVQHHGQLPVRRLSDVTSGLCSLFNVLLSWPVTWLNTIIRDLVDNL